MADIGEVTDPVVTRPPTGKFKVAMTAIGTAIGIPIAGAMIFMGSMQPADTDGNVQFSKLERSAAATSNSITDKNIPTHEVICKADTVKVRDSLGEIISLGEITPADTIQEPDRVKIFSTGRNNFKLYMGQGETRIITAMSADSIYASDTIRFDTPLPIGRCWMVPVYYGQPVIVDRGK